MIDLRSDTLTQPTKEMREAVLTAVVGDDGRLGEDGRGEDPTVRQLEEEMAKRTGKEAALFCNSGTMGNTVALLTWCRPKDRVLMDSWQHAYKSEKVAFDSRFGQLVGVPYTSDEKGLPSVEEIKDLCENQPIRLLCLENTHNFKGGTTLPLSLLQSLYETAHTYHIPVHMDGARIWNAAAYLGVSIKEICAYTDSVMVCLSKGLGAPVGSVLCGSASFIEEARRVRKLLGGTMRQAGVLAAPALEALKTGPTWIKEDQEKARYGESLLNSLVHAKISTKVQTNILMLDIRETGYTGERYCEKAKEKGLLIRPIRDGYVRLVFYHGITKEDVKEAARILLELDRECGQRK